MIKRMLVLLAVVAVILAALATFKTKQVQASIAEGESFRQPPEAVTTIIAESEEWPYTLEGIGTVTAVQGVMVSADLSGLVERIAFESGRTVREGDLLITLDRRQEKAQLAAAEAAVDLARRQFDRVAGLRTKGVTSQSELDEVEAQLAQAKARIAEIEATIARKTIQAPFGGVLGIRQVNLGQYLTGGAPIVALQSLDPIYVDFTVPQQELERLRVGSEVEIEAHNGAFQLTGEVAAIDSVVDPATRNLSVRAELGNPEGRLRPGMFVEVRALLGGGDSLVTVPASAISYAPYGDSVFIVEQMEGPDGASYRGVRQQFVQVGANRGDQVALTSGVEPGEEVVTSGVFKLRNGAAVVVNNEIQPGNDPSPQPANS